MEARRNRPARRMNPMTTDSDRELRDYFTAHSQEWVSASPRQAMCVLFAPVSEDPEISERCASVLSEAELEQVARRSVKSHRAEFAQRRAFRRFCAATALDSILPLSEITFAETTKGRPYCPDAPEFCFSFSSCRFGMLGSWSSTCNIGVDIEDRTRDLEAVEIARQFFRTAETEVIKSLDPSAQKRTFYRLWTLKEAALKSIGEGLPFGLDTFELALDPGPKFVDSPADYGEPQRFRAREFQGHMFSAALVMRQ